jgi:hypothetical protein
MSEFLLVRYVLASPILLEAYICRSQLEAYIYQNGNLMVPMTKSFKSGVLALFFATSSSYYNNSKIKLSEERIYER